MRSRGAAPQWRGRIAVEALGEHDAPALFERDLPARRQEALRRHLDDVLPRAKVAFPDAAPDGDSVDGDHRAGRRRLDSRRGPEIFGDERDGGDLVRAHGHRRGLRADTAVATQHDGVIARCEPTVPRRLAHRDAVDDDVERAPGLLGHAQPTVLGERHEASLEHGGLLTRDVDSRLEGREAGLEHAHHVAARRQTQRSGERRRPSIAPVDDDARPRLGTAQRDGADGGLKLLCLADREVSIRLGQIGKSRSSASYRSKASSKRPSLRRHTAAFLVAARVG